MDLKGIIWLAIILWCIIFWLAIILWCIIFWLGITIALVRW